MPAINERKRKRRGGGDWLSDAWGRLLHKPILPPRGIRQQPQRPPPPNATIDIRHLLPCPLYCFRWVVTLQRAGGGGLETKTSEMNPAMVSWSRSVGLNRGKRQHSGESELPRDGFGFCGPTRQQVDRLLGLLRKHDFNQTVQIYRIIEPNSWNN
jgi:hypothetical protein